MRNGCNERNCPTFGKCPKYTGACLKTQKSIEEIKQAAKEKQQNALTAEQIKNWRQVLSLTFGPAMFLIPDEDIQKFRDNFQIKVNAM
jgi:hypothetical protein